MPERSRTIPGRQPDDTAELTRKRFARRQRARRWLAWRRVLAIVVVVALVAGSVWLVFFSEVLSVKKVTVQGSGLLSESDVEAAAEVPLGDPLARVDLDAITSRVGSLAAVRKVDVSRKWPDGILITLEERVAVAVVEIGGSLRGMDEDGVIFRRFDRAPKTLPRIRTTADTGREALREAATVVGVLPTDLARRVEFVDVKTVDQISFALRDGRSVIWGSADESTDKARVLEALLKQKRAGVKEYDVSVPGQPTTRN